MMIRKIMSEISDSCLVVAKMHPMIETSSLSHDALRTEQASLEVTVWTSEIDDAMDRISFTDAGPANLVVFAACNTPKVSRLNRLARFGRIKVENHVAFIPISLGTWKFALIISDPFSLKGLVVNTCFCPVFLHLFLIVNALFAVHAACSKPCWSSDLPNIVTIFLVQVLPDFLPCFPFELYAIIKWIAAHLHT